MASLFVAAWIAFVASWSVLYYAPSSGLKSGEAAPHIIACYSVLSLAGFSLAFWVKKRFKLAMVALVAALMALFALLTLPIP
jgi:hypothetical protein